MQRPASKKDGKRLWAAAKDGDVETIGSMLNTIDMNVNEYQDEVSICSVYDVHSIRRERERESVCSIRVSFSL